MSGELLQETDVPLGPGKYDWICTMVRQEADADGAIVIVLGGRDGMGFSVQADLPTQLKLPELLEEVARHMRADLKKGKL
jgi:hypothetical protein